jgi:segregation and condensation protein B
MNDLKWILEALLMSSTEPLSVEKLQSVFSEEERPTQETLEIVLAELQQDYAERAVELKFLAGGYAFQTKKVYKTWVARLFSEKPAKYSSAMLETLAIIAYRQPVTRADIEEIRGVAVNSSLLKTLLERQWIRAAGRRDVPGKPSVYITTQQFLDYFNLKSLANLPALHPIEPQTEVV